MQFEDDDLFQTMRTAFGAADYGGAGPDDMANDVLPDEALAAEEEALTHDSVIEPDLDDLHDKVSISWCSRRFTFLVEAIVSRRRGKFAEVCKAPGIAILLTNLPNLKELKRRDGGQGRFLVHQPLMATLILILTACAHYKRRLWRWVRITREFLPANEQALRAREQLRGEAELEFEEVGDERFDHEEGIQRLLDDLEVSFGERALFRQGGIIKGVRKHW